MNKAYNTYDTVLSIMGISFSLVNIQEFIGILIGVLTLINIFYKMISQIVKHVKNKEFDKVSEDIENGIEDLKKEGKEKWVD